MTDLEIRALGAEFTSQVFKRGEIIVRAGSDSANFYVIFAGQAEVLDASGRTVDRLSRGDHFGEAALLAHARVQSTLRALTALEVLRLEEYGFDRLLRTSARFDAASGESLKRVRVLRRIPLFAAFDGRDLTRLAARMRRVEAQASEEIVRQGETGESFYVIDSGKVSVQVDNVQRATLGPGEYFGEIALMMDAPRTATVVALQPTVMLLMEAGDFKAMLRDSKAIEQGMQRAGSRRVLSNERWMRRARQPDAAG
jgi:CRP-like cAMP-binding protein